IGSPHVCGGAIVSYDPALVLTAAHCMDVPMQQFESPFFVLYNDVERSKLVTVPIEDWTIHPNYNASGMINIKYDTAILRLKRPLIESAHVKRAVFWPPTAPLSTPLRGEMVGFGYVDSEGQLAKTLQFLPLEVTRFDAYNYIEARSDTETVVACHGDSGGPLIVPQSIQNPYTNGTVTVPFVMGTLTRILGARDISPDKLTCPVPSDQSVTHSSAAQNTVVEAFTNAPSMLDWISSVSGISVANLTDPFYNLPALPCSAD
ncbi:trypsin-like cysteine/serine peptidase domain-containing protein, partial [Mycotypha africana]|uniref:trypsin-like cysteine/serine peptidase domain-containing protein n=1 Tax=Mycotypha africana TaxID=64632 RepID=UPI0023016D6E